MFGVVMLEARMKSESEEESQNDFVRVCVRGGKRVSTSGVQESLQRRFAC